MGRVKIRHSELCQDSGCVEGGLHNIISNGACMFGGQ